MRIQESQNSPASGDTNTKWHTWISISTGKNQSMKVRGALYILTCEYNYKVITECDTILQEYYITDRRKCENTKIYTIMNNIKGAHELQKENSRAEQRLE